jgi:dihydrofolate reductase
VIMGSGSLVTQLTDVNLIDEYQIVVTPVALGNGRTLFQGIKEKRKLELISSRTFKNGNVVLTYRCRLGTGTFDV